MLLLICRGEHGNEREEEVSSDAAAVTNVASERALTDSVLEREEHQEQQAADAEQ